MRNLKRVVDSQVLGRGTSFAFNTGSVLKISDTGV